jgi:hypothetical protein
MRRARSTDRPWPRHARRRSPRNRSPCFPMRTCGACWPTAQARTSATGVTSRSSGRSWTPGCRLEGMAGLRYSADDPEASDVDLRSRVVRIMPKGRRELVLPIGVKAARDIDRYIRVRAGHRTRPTPGCGSARRAGSRRAASIR